MSRPGSRPTSRSSRPVSRGPSSAGQRRTGSGLAGLGVTHGELQVTLRDCESLIRAELVGLPGLYFILLYFTLVWSAVSGGFTKAGSPLLLFPNNPRFSEVLETDLHLLLKYFVSIIPNTDQGPAFALVIDRAGQTWRSVQQVSRLCIYTEILTNNVCCRSSQRSYPSSLPA